MKRKHLIIDDIALSLRKPSAAPLVDPAEAVAIALSMLPDKSTGCLCGPDSIAVRHILLSVKLAGWKFEPR